MKMQFCTERTFSFVTLKFGAYAQYLRTVLLDFTKYLEREHLVSQLMKIEPHPRPLTACS